MITPDDLRVVPVVTAHAVEGAKGAVGYVDAESDMLAITPHLSRADAWSITHRATGWVAGSNRWGPLSFECAARIRRRLERAIDWSKVKATSDLRKPDRSMLSHADREVVEEIYAQEVA